MKQFKKSSSARLTLAANIKKYRNKLGFSQEELAEETGLHRTYIGSVERGERNVSIDNIQLIANALKTNVPNLLSENIIE